MSAAYLYRAFISYSHADKAAADRLMHALETYRLPKRLQGGAEGGRIVPARIGKLFRDRDELPAAEDLSAEVKKALGQSEFMIVLCSPDAAASRWVNREIIEFKKLTGERRILSVILSGEPFASDKDRPEQECFPPALRFKLGKNGALTKTPAEPLAADFRPGGDGERRGLLKLVAGLMGIGLDQLIERDLQRRMRRVMAVTAASLIAMLGMGLLTYEAVDARREAERHRGEAEGLIEFMLTDLRDKLEPVGRLDVLDAVGEEAMAYYDRQPLDTMPDDALGRRARAFHLLGEIDDKQGDLAGARDKFEAAYLATAALLAQDPDNPDRIFDHSQSAYWVGYARRNEGRHEEALESIEEYAELARQLTEIERKPEWVLEYAYAESSRGTLLLRQLQKPAAAIGHFQTALELFLNLADEARDPTAMLKEAADLHAWLADTHLALKDYATARNHRTEQLGVIRALEVSMPDDKDLQRFKATNLFGRGRVERSAGNHLEAAKSFGESAAIMSMLTYHDAENMRWIELSAVTHLFLANSLVHLEDYALAMAKLKTASDLEAALFEGKTPSEMQVWEVRVWRETIEAKLDLALGRQRDAWQKASAIQRRLSALNETGITPWKGIEIGPEIEQILASKP